MAVYVLGRNPWLFCLCENSTPWQQHRKMVCLLAGVIETCLVLPGSYLSQRKPSYHYCHLKEMNATNHIKASGMSRPNQAWIYHGNLPRRDQLGCREPLGLWEFNGLFLLSLLKAHNLYHSDCYNFCGQAIAVARRHLDGVQKSIMQGHMHSICVHYLSMYCTSQSWWSELSGVEMCFTLQSLLCLTLSNQHGFDSSV